MNALDNSLVLPQSLFFLLFLYILFKDFLLFIANMTILSSVCDLYLSEKWVAEFYLLFWCWPLTPAFFSEYIYKIFILNITTTFPSRL